MLKALEMAVSQRDLVKGALLHSDWGVQYRGNEYQGALKAYSLKCSMSRKGSWWDNAVTASFFSRLQVELVYAEN